MFMHGNVTEVIFSPCRGIRHWSMANARTHTSASGFGAIVAQCYLTLPLPGNLAVVAIILLLGPRTLVVNSNSGHQSRICPFSTPHARLKPPVLAQ
jgi:hypothetical protein